MNLKNKNNSNFQWHHSLDRRMQLPCSVKCVEQFLLSRSPTIVECSFHLVFSASVVQMAINYIYSAYRSVEATYCNNCRTFDFTFWSFRPKYTLQACTVYTCHSNVCQVIMFSPHVKPNESWDFRAF